MTHPPAPLLLDAALRIHESSGPAAAFRALDEALRDGGLARAAWWVDAPWASGGADAEGAPPAAAARARGEAGTFRVAVEGETAAEAVVLALGDEAGGVVVLAEAGSETEWERVRAALAAVVARERAVDALERERDTLLNRAEESEALHVLGLTANRTLDPDEVLGLVARFTRTLLGAHYVTVSTREGELARPMAAVGLRAGTAVPDDDPFALRVIAAGRPLRVGEDGGLGPADYPFHAAQGMQGGLGVPLALYGETFGALVVGYRRAYDPLPQDIRLALTLAGHAAVAISNARLHGTLAGRSEELERALDEVRRTARAKERFFASISHELRTPLNGILGFQTLVVDGMAGEITPEARDYLQRANRAAHTLLGLVDEVLDYAKMESGKVALRLDDASVREIVEEAVAALEPVAAERSVRLASTEGAGGLIRTDVARVRQILANLLSNAIKFTPEGGEVVLSAVSTREDGVAGLEFRVRDTGPGISAADQARIFEEFEQVRGTVGGTGLGLPISRKLARLLGGDVTVESAPGTGSTFVLRLPTGYPQPTGTQIAPDPANR